MKSIEVTARTVEEAISDGLLKLNCSISDCRVDILHEGAKGLFGFFGSKPACVRLTLLDDGGEPAKSFAAPARENVRQQPQAAPAPQKERPAPAPKPLPAPPAAQPQKKQPAEKSKAEPQPDKPKARQDVLERFKSAPLPGKSAAAPEKMAQPAKKPAPAKPAMKPAPARVREDRFDDAHEPAVREPVPAPEHIAMHDPDSVEGRAQQFLLGLTKRMGVNVQVEAHVGEDGHLFATMYDDTLGILIGRRGETLDALQYLTSLQVNKGSEEYTRVTLDTENYRAKREEALTRLATRMANRAVKTGRKVSLEPMNPYERRILHASLQNYPNVSTHSEGDEPYRHVVVVPQK